MKLVSDIKSRLLANLADPLQTSFTDSKVHTLLNEATEFIISQQAIQGKYTRILTEDITVTVNTSQYTLPTNFREIILVEIVDGVDREEGTVITYNQRNTPNDKWCNPVVYVTWEEVNAVFGAQLNYAEVGAPFTNHTLRVSYAPTPIDIISDSTELRDIEDKYINLLLLRATFMGFGGEKNADTFWASMFRDALNQAISNWSRDQSDMVVQIDGSY